ncbi:sigma factor-like helix-turn-helix DNA-binding protein, partial [[Kitasatospora] papulosa]|uniref:sigma factor-like helix-turn-helix DNA-binding protein n=1 Tax=[Kitasatospora] papulosa TaxID=1464011 RepID=UPI0036287B0C
TTATTRRRDWLVRVSEHDDRSPLDVMESLVGPGPDTTVCAVAELLEETGETPAWPPACYADQIAALTPRQREVLELRCVDGMTTDSIGARLGIARQAVESTLRKALIALGGSGRVGGQRSRGAGQPLPAGWERVLDRLPSQTHRDIIRLRASGASFAQIADEVGLHRSSAHEYYSRALLLIREMVVDHRLDPAPAAPAAPAKSPAAAAGCSRPCATGCALRRREVAA